MLSIFATLKDFAWLYILLALVIVVFCYNLKVTELDHQLDDARDQIASLQQSIATQNSAIEQLKVAGEKARIAQIEKEKRQLSAINASKMTASNILNTRVQPDCVSALQFELQQAIKMRDAQ